MAAGIRFSPVQVYAEGSIPLPEPPSGIFLFRIEVDAEGGASGIKLAVPMVSVRAVQGIATGPADDTLPEHVAPVLPDDDSKIQP